jgi:hypothetical protein
LVNYGVGSAFPADRVVLSNFRLAVPEPTSTTLLMGGMTLLGLRRRRSR